MKIIFSIIIIICWSCTFNSNTEKYQQRRDNIVLVNNKLKEIDLNDVFVGQFARLYILNDYLIITDVRSFDKQIHLFNVNDFSHLTSVADRGQGPLEITNLGFIGINENNNEFYASDHGKQQILCYNMDSILANPLYFPTIKMKMNARQFPDRYHYVNDSIVMGVIIEPVANSSYDHATAKININSGKIYPVIHKHPKIERKRISFAMSEQLKVYIECYHFHDLMIIYNMDGSIKCNIYGKEWNSKVTNRFRYYKDVKICDEFIVATFSNGKNRYSSNERENPTQFLVFNQDGDYIKTLETGSYIMDFCYDKLNKRLLMHLDDEMQFAYLDFREIMY